MSQRIATVRVCVCAGTGVCVWWCAGAGVCVWWCAGTGVCVWWCAGTAVADPEEGPWGPLTPLLKLTL